MDAIKSLGSYLLRRMSEPSSYAGIGLIFAAFKLPHSNDLAGYVTQFGLGFAGIMAYVLKEKGYIK